MVSVMMLILLCSVLLFSYGQVCLLQDFPEKLKARMPL